MTPAEQAERHFVVITFADQPAAFYDFANEDKAREIYDAAVASGVVAVSRWWWNGSSVTRQPAEAWVNEALKLVGEVRGGT